LIVTAWIFLLLASGLPRIILQEVFGYPVSFNSASMIAAVVIFIGLILTLIWNEIGGLRPFFLVKGDMNAEAGPVSLLGIKPSERWSQLGCNFAVILSLGTLIFLVLAGRPPLNIVIRALPFLPFVLIAAVLNAFNEEMTYKASFLSVLENVVGKYQALWLMAAYFGIGHFYGIPYGVIGVIMAGFLGWFLGKSMLETRGLGWAWLIHFVQDVLIFAFLAIGSIVPGGG
jgi:CAAX amino terminal protease family.